MIGSKYEREGYDFPFDVLSPKEVERFRRAYLDLSVRLGGSPKAVEVSQLHAYFPWAYELALHPSILDVVEKEIGPDILVWGCQAFPKRARDPGFVTMHQDGTYWGLRSGEITTAWIALTESTPENGCMRVLPGSHKLPILPHVDTYAENNQLTRGQQVEMQVDDAEVMNIELQPGQMSLHHVRIIHGSNANFSHRHRIGIVVRYMTPDVESVEAAQKVVLARGEDRFGNWERMKEPPTYETADVAIAAQRQGAQRHLAALTKTESAAGREGR